MIKEYRKKPVVIKAVQWTGENVNEILEFCADAEFDMGIDGPKNLEIKTLEGTMQADIGDYIIQGVKGEFYPCKPDVFEKTYEPVD
jgi:hypothetical protein